jgi:hypothetical protein
LLANVRIVAAPVLVRSGAYPDAHDYLLQAGKEAETRVKLLNLRQNRASISDTGNVMRVNMTEAETLQPARGLLSGLVLLCTSDGSARENVRSDLAQRPPSQPAVFRTEAERVSRFGISNAVTQAGGPVLKERGSVAATIAQTPSEPRFVPIGLAFRGPHLGLSISDN